MKLKLKTVDVWDTLLRRKCHPDLIKLATAKYFYYKHITLHGVSDINELFRKRIEIEREIGQSNSAVGFDDEYLFEDVIFSWCKYFLSDLTDVELKQYSDEICKYEFDLEMSLTTPDENIVSLLNEHPSDRTIFLSDFYMSKERLQQLIYKNNLAMHVSDGISSVDIKLNKRSGRLFDYVKKEFELSSGEWLHIGDNEWSDVTQPEKRGIKCLHYLPEVAHKTRIEHESGFHDRNKIYERLLQSIKNSAPNSEINNPVYNFGIKVSPFILGYVFFILEKALETSCKKIYFFTREGEFFIQAFHLVMSKLKIDYPDVYFPEYDILEVSRLATFSASISEVTTNEMMRIWNLYSSQSMTAFFKTLNIEDAGLKELLIKYDIQADEVVRYPWQDVRVQSLFEDENFKSIILCHRNLKRKLLLSYLHNKGLDNNIENVCVVDVGWRGTIQDNIALCLPNVSFHGVYLGLAKFLNSQPSNSIKYAYGPDLNNSAELPHYLDSVAPIEMITNSPSGSVIGYIDSENVVQAIRKIDEGENKAWELFTKEFQKGILFSIDKWKDDPSFHLLTSNELRPIALKIWGDLITGGNESLNDAFTQLNHNETFGLGGYVAKNKTPTLTDILNSIFDRDKRRELIDFIVANQWSDGVRRKKDVSLINRQVLAILIDLAVLYKRKVKRR
ncbi:hypothetical protein [Pantoea anthophila]|uniref:hypothetical protein n=1 Tax=Pantoea anthophila TaxID=470931 RepID=UPI00301C348E